MSYNSCVGRASREWFDFLYNKGTREVIYWKTREEDFKAIESGVKMFLYDTEKEEIYGYGYYYGEKEILTVSDAWNKYGTKNGAATFKEFLNLLNGKTTVSQEITQDKKICCIKLKDLKKFIQPVKYVLQSNQFSIKKLYDKVDTEILSTLCVMGVEKYGDRN